MPSIESSGYNDDTLANLPSSYRNQSGSGAEPKVPNYLKNNTFKPPNMSSSIEDGAYAAPEGIELPVTQYQYDEQPIKAGRGLVDDVEERPIRPMGMAGGNKDVDPY